MKFDFNKEMKIDKFHLDKELEEQAQRYTDWAIRASEAEDEEEKCKREYELIRSDYEEKIRKNPELFDLGKLKLTESLIKQKAEKQVKVKRHYDRWIKARRTTKILGKIEKGFAQRKGLLEVRANRDLRMYYGDPKLGRENDNNARRLIRNDLKREGIKRRKT